MSDIAQPKVKILSQNRGRNPGLPILCFGPKSQKSTLQLVLSPLSFQQYSCVHSPLTTQEAGGLPCL